MADYGAATSFPAEVQASANTIPNRPTGSRRILSVSPNFIALTPALREYAKVFADRLTDRLFQYRRIRVPGSEAGPL